MAGISRLQTKRLVAAKRAHADRARHPSRPASAGRRSPRAPSRSCASRPACSGSSTATGGSATSSSAPTPRSRGQGLAALPEPSPGDLFLDFESDPWALEGGLEFLIGTVVEENGAPVYATLWAHDRDAEKRAFESLIDTIMARLEKHPGMHVYHYGAYEAGAIKRLMGRYATREDEVDRLLRGGVLVDLFSVVRQGVRVSQESYSLKKVEKLYMPQREGPKTRPGFALVEYEKWLEHPDQQSILDGLAAYNRDDCVSTWMMRTWLEGLRKEAEAAFGIDARTAEARGRRAERRARRAARGDPEARRGAHEGRPRRRRPAHEGAAGPLDPRPAPRLAPPRGEAAVVAPLLPDEGPDRGPRRLVRRDRRAAGSTGRWGRSTSRSSTATATTPSRSTSSTRGTPRTTRPRASPPAPSGPSTPPPARSTSSAGGGTTRPTRPP